MVIMINFGKYAGQQYEDIKRWDPPYLLYLASMGKTIKVEGHEASCVLIDAGKAVLPVGVYRGNTIEYVYSKDASYLDYFCGLKDKSGNPYKTGRHVCQFFLDKGLSVPPKMLASMSYWNLDGGSLMDLEITPSLRPGSTIPAYPE